MTRWLHPFLALALLLALAPAGHAQPKDTLTVALVSHAPTLDPHMHFERVGILVNINMFDSLLHRNTKLEYEPSLATSWKAINDTTWEFKLRKGVKFHNGDPLTAEDVKFSFDRVIEPGKEKKKSPQYGNIRAIKEVRIVDADTVHLITDKPFPLLLERLVFFPIVPKKHIEKVGDEAFGTTAAGRDRALEVRGVEARPVHPAGGLRRPLARQAGLQAPGLPGRARGGHPDRRDEDGRRGPHPQRVGGPRPRAEGPPADLRVLDARSCACTTSSSTCASRPSTRRPCGRPPTTPSTSRPSSRSSWADSASRWPPSCSRWPSASTPRCSPTPTIPRRPRSSWPRPASPTASTSPPTAPSSSSGRCSRRSPRC